MGYVNRLVPEALLFRGMTTRLKAFLEPPGYGPAPDTHNKKALCQTFAYVGRSTNNSTKVSSYGSRGKGSSC